MKTPLVSIIIPTKNNQKTIERCVQSCVAQTYPNIEVIVIDNFSDDQTPHIAEKLGAKVVSFGPERNLQRPKGAEVARGEWLVYIDSDMYMGSTIIQECIDQLNCNTSIGAFALPELSIGHGFWTRAKALERSFYINYEPMLAVRMYHRSVYDRAGGWDPALISGEDFDLDERIRSQSIEIGRSQSFILHDEGEIELCSYLKKKFYYAQFLKGYLRNSRQRHTGRASKKIYFLRSCFYTNPKRALRYFGLYLGMFTLLGLTAGSFLAGLMFGQKPKSK